MLAKLIEQLRTARGKVGPEIEVDRDLSMRVFLNDTLCLLMAWDRDGGEVLRDERALPEKMSDVRDLLASAIEILSPDIERRVGKVEVFLDDPGTSIIDSRQAKLNHFEGRTLAEFGKYQLGGKPVCFASHKFGDASAQEAEKRVIAYISEDRLTSILFALGRLARFATFFGPWSLQALFDRDDQESWAHLSFHRAFSTLTLANAAAGALAVRHLPFGSQDLVQAYVQTHGVDSIDATAALAERCRLGPVSPVKNDPVTFTGTFVALNPVMTDLSGEIAATTDYFEFQRLAGRASSLLLTACGTAVAGFGNWLGEMLQMDVTQPSDKFTGDLRSAPALNMLEGMRAGLLKLGNQHFDFIGGQFVPTKGAAGESNDRVKPTTLAKWKGLSSQPVSAATLKTLVKPALVATLAIIAVYVGYGMLTAPAGVDKETAANLYNASLARMEQTTASTAAATKSEPVLWAKDMVSISAAMPYDMKLKHVSLTPGMGNVASSLEITGILPRYGKDNLELVGRFITRLTTNAALHKRFSEVSFAGVGEDAKDGGETTFKVVAKLGVQP